MSAAHGLRIALYQPDIPQNLGAVMRLGACFSTPIDLIEPCGFALTDRALKRSAMDYGALVALTRHTGFSAFLAAPERAAGRLVLVETDGRERLDRFVFAPGDTLLFGRESAGTPPEVAAYATTSVVIPMAAGARSLNVAMAAGVCLFTALCQLGLPEALTGETERP